MARRAPTWVVVAALVGVTAIWGSTFPMVKDAIERIDVFDFLAWRFCLATLLMLALRPRSLVRLGRRGRRDGLWLGLALGVGYVFQTLGLEHADAAVSGFITGMFVALTPVVALIWLRTRVPLAGWAAVALATVGLGLLSLRGFEVGRGEALTFCCAIAFAVHIVGLGEWSKNHESYALAVVQLAVVGVGCAIAAAPDGIELPRGGTVWRALAVTAVLASAVGFVVQTWAQSRLSPTRAAVIMTMEPVFAGLFAVWVASETLGARDVAGAVLILAAMLLVELGPRHGAEGATPRLEA